MSKFDEKFGFVWPYGAPEIMPAKKHIYNYTIQDPFRPAKPVSYAYTKKQIHDVVEKEGKFVPHLPAFELESTIMKRKSAKK
jgi:hypothetical protein